MHKGCRGNNAACNSALLYLISLNQTSLSCIKLLLMQTEHFLLLLLLHSIKSVQLAKHKVAFIVKTEKSALSTVSMWVCKSTRNEILRIINLYFINTFFGFWDFWMECSLWCSKCQKITGRNEKHFKSNISS